MRIPGDPEWGDGGPAPAAPAAPGDGRSGRSLGRRERAMVLATCCCALFISTLDNTIANVALPSIGRDLDTSAQALQWIVDAYIVVRGCLLLSAGALGDRFGRRRLFQGGLVVFGLGSLLCSLAPTAETLIGARVLQALGGCFLVPSSLALIADAFPGRAERARAIGIWSATTGVSTGLGPVVGGALAQGVGWRSVFWVNIPIVAVAVALAARYVRESRAAAARRLDLPGQVLVFVVLGTITSGFIEAAEGGWTSALVLGLFATGVAALGAFVAVEARRAEPLLEPALFRSPAFSGAAALAVLAFVVFAGFLFVNTLYLQEIRGFSALEAGLLMMPTTIGNVVLSPLSGRITAERGPRLPVTLSALLMLAGTLVLARAGAHSALWLLVVGYALIGSGVGLVNTPITNAAVSGMTADRGGVAGAITSTFRQVGSSLGVALLGTLTFAGFAGALPGRVRRLGLPADARERIIAAAHHANASGGLGRELHRAGAGVRHAIAGAFASGLHEAYLVAAALSLVAVVVGLTTFRGRPATAR